MPNADIVQMALSSQATIPDSSAEGGPAGTHHKNFVPVVVTDNNERCQINEAITTHLFRRSQGSSMCNASSSLQAFLRIDATYATVSRRDLDEHNRPRVQDGSPVADLRMFKVLACLKFCSMDHHLRLFVGMEVIITENLCLPLGIANGSHAYVVSLQLTETSSALPPRYDEQGMRHYSIADVGRVILHLVHPSGAPTSMRLENDLPPDHFSVFPGAEYLDIKKVVKASKDDFKMVQLPMVPAFCLTAHKTQGLTLSKLILASTTAPNGRTTTARFLYVVLSRLRSLAGLTLLQPLPQNPNHAAYKIGAPLIAELSRLTRLESSTLDRSASLARQFKLKLNPRVRQGATSDQLEADTSFTSADAAAVAAVRLRMGTVSKREVVNASTPAAASVSSTTAHAPAAATTQPTVPRAARQRQPTTAATKQRRQGPQISAHRQAESNDSTATSSSAGSCSTCTCSCCSGGPRPTESITSTSCPRIRRLWFAGGDGGLARTICR
jgi:hypothetical protein